MTRSGVVTAVGLLAFLGAVAACSREAVDVSAEVEAAEQAFVAFDFHGAREIFAAALERDPGNAEAAYGYARSLLFLNLYEEARPAFERALALAPDDPRVHEGYVNSLAIGGVFLGRRAWLERALEEGAEAIRAYPDRVQLYTVVEMAAGDLNQPEVWGQTLDSLEAEIGDSPVFRVHHTRAQLTRARSAGDEDQVAAIENGLREQLAAAAAAEAADSGAPARAGRRYLLAVGHQLLGEPEEARRRLVLLDETAEGRRMGAMEVHFEIYYADFRNAREAPREEQLEIVERWKERFQPDWDYDFRAYAVPLEAELGLLIDEARARTDEGEPPAGELLDRIIAVGDALVRIETGGWATAQRRKTAEALIDLGIRLDEVLRIADEGIAELQDRRAGVLYPGLRGAERELERDNQIAALELIRGRALSGMDRPVEAEEALRHAAEISPRSDRLAALGELLADEGRFDEAYETLLTALAYGAQDEEIADEVDRLRAVALAAAEDTGRDAMTLDRDLETRRAEVGEEMRLRLVSERLDREAPDFELTDIEGNEWRLSQLRGKVVLLNFWATWCGPCREELPYYQELAQEYEGADDVVFLAISTDVDRSTTRAFIDENDYGFTVLFDEGASIDFNVTGIPSHFILGPEGRIQYSTEGFGGPEEYAQEMRARIEALRVH